MEYIIIIILLIIITGVLAIIYEINIKKLKNFVNLEEEKYKEITKKYPNNIQICKSILKMLNNENVNIEEDKKQKTSLYIALTNKIIIGDIQKSYTCIQTIAHECLHSIQNRKILLFNFFYSNLYLLYFIVVLILALFNMISKNLIYLNIMIVFSYVYYFVRSYLENDAMIKARYISEKYFKEENILNEEEITKILKSYDILNDIGIKTTNFQLFIETIGKIVVLIIAFLI